MSKFQAFLKKNKKGKGEVSFSLPNFDEPLTIRVLNGREVDAINERCFVMKTGKKGRQERVFDGVKYNRELCVASIIYPDLNDQELQASYGAMGAVELYGEMFNWGEQGMILEQVSLAAGVLDINEEIEEAKN